MHTFFVKVKKKEVGGMEKIQQVKTWMLDHLFALKIALGVLGIGLIFSSLVFARSSAVSEEIPSLAVDSTLFNEDSSEEKSRKEDVEVPDEKMVVDVKGAVLNPGVYSVKEEMRLIDAIELAGGFLTEADSVGLNLSLRLQDQMVIYVPLIGEEPKFEEVDREENVKQKDQNSEVEAKLNINQAEANELQTLTGIGAKKAQMIVEYRQENGSFQSIEDLKKISGIGEKIFEGLKEQITVG